MNCELTFVTTFPGRRPIASSFATIPLPPSTLRTTPL